MKREADLTEVGIVTSVAKITADPLLPVLPQSDVLTADLARLRLLLVLSAPSPALFPVFHSFALAGPATSEDGFDNRS